MAEDAFLAAQTIRGLKAKKAVPCTLQNKEEVLTFLKTSVQKKIPQGKLRGEERIYKALGLVPEDFHYVDQLLKLYSEQAGGYYDPESKRYVMASWLPSMLQPTIAAHELTHALQDQYYNLVQFMDDNAFSGDELLAHSALVEGDATAVMNDFQLGVKENSAVAMMTSVEPIILQTVIGSYLTQNVSAAPEVIRNTMIFPYTSGLRFVHYFLRKGGYKALNAVFKFPPRSSAEILHPELYPQPAASIAKEVVTKALQGQKIIYQDAMGEFFASSWLSSFTKNKADAANAAAGLQYDTAIVSENNSVVWITLWKTKSDINEFLKVSQAVTGERKNIQISCDQGTLTCVVTAQ